MKKSLILSGLWMLIASFTYAQQSIVNTTKSNTKDRVVVETSDKTVSSTLQAKQAPPIPGIGVVVKRNPGGGASRVGTTNEKGEIMFSIKEKGDYKIILTYDADVAATGNHASARSKGEGVKGVKVGLGHNPPGCCNESNCCPKKITNDNGEVIFQNLEIGQYQIVVQKADRGTTTPKAQNL